MDCLNEKPSINRKIEKGRRHKGYDKLKKHLSRDAYLSKSIIIDENIGNREKSRIVCETSADSISPNVSYSLNRKNRWDTITPISLNINAINCIPKDVTVAVVEQMNTIPDIGCVNEKTNKHFIAGCVTGVTTINEDGHVTVKSANSPAGAHLASLLGNNKENSRSSDSENVNANVFNDSSKGKAQVRYHINTPQNNTDYSIGVHFKRQLKAKLKEKKFIGKTSRKLKNKYNVNTTEIMSDSDEVSEVEEFYSDYNLSSPKFSLSDFVKESSPVVVDEQPVDSIDKLPSSVVVDKQPVNNTGKLISLNDNTIELKQLMTLPEELRVVSKWVEFNFDDIDKLIDGNYYNMKWIDKNKTHFQIDFGDKLKYKIRPNAKIKLLLIIRKFKGERNMLQITFNSSLKIKDHTRYISFKRGIKSTILNKRVNGVSTKDFLDTCIYVILEWIESIRGIKRTILNKRVNDVSTKDFLDTCIYVILEWIESNISGINEDHIEKYFVHYEYEKNYNSDEISKTVVPFSEDEFWENLTNDQSKNLRIESSENEYLDSRCESNSDGDFETVNSCEFNNKEMSSEYKFHDEQCAFCIGPLLSDTYISLNDCKHSFCSECIRKTLYKQLRLEDTPLHCPICNIKISINFLLLIFPLPFISSYFYLQYTKEMKKKGMKTTHCLKCKNIVTFDSIEKYNVINCQKCNVYWCFLCNKPPHFPLTCEQNVEWKFKFNMKDESIRKTEINDSSKYELKKLLKITKEAHDIRFDNEKLSTIRRSWKISDFKNCYRETFLKHRKTLLFLLEYGFGWFYMNRNIKHDKYDEMKTTLMRSFNKLKDLDDAIIKNRKENWEMEMQNIRKNIDNILNEFCNLIYLNQ
uniref:RING-type domain-containing protein n=1 Tax=Strongyloides papillosus TaxID=174720 RepID=A0A0N5BD19_STREA